MLLFLFYWKSHSLTLNDIAFGMCSGIETFDERVIPMAKTWYQLIPSIHVYSDEIPKESLNEILNSSNHLNIYFHETPTFSHYMVGTRWDDKWNSVQNRHLYAFGDLYFHEPDKAWYVLGDDDTFMFPNSLVTFLSSVPEDDIRIFGRGFLVFEHLNVFFKNPDINHYFVQGGAGIAIPAKVMKVFAPCAQNCTQIFSGVNFPSDMRLSACLERFFGFRVDEGAREKSLFRSWRGFHSDVPMKENVGDIVPISYHHIVAPLCDQLWMAVFTKWKNSNGVDMYIDWSFVAMKELNIELGRRGLLCEFQFMFRIYLDGRKGEQMICQSQPEPVFKNDTKRKHPREFVQRFEGNITMRYICDDSISGETIVFDSFLLDEEGCSFKVACPSIRKYPINHEGTKSPLHLIKSPVQEL